MLISLKIAKNSIELCTKSDLFRKREMTQNGILVPTASNQLNLPLDVFYELNYFPSP